MKILLIEPAKTPVALGSEEGRARAPAHQPAGIPQEQSARAGARKSGNFTAPAAGSEETDIAGAPPGGLPVNQSPGNSYCISRTVREV